MPPNSRCRLRTVNFLCLVTVHAYRGAGSVPGTPVRVVYCLLSDCRVRQTGVTAAAPEPSAVTWSRLRRAFRELLLKRPPAACPLLVTRGWEMPAAISTAAQAVCCLCRHIEGALVLRLCVYSLYH